MIFAWMVLLTALSVGFVVFPLLRGRKVPLAGLDSTPAVLLDQLDEVQCDLDRRVISKSEAAAAQQEIKRRILAAARRSTRGQIAENTGGRGALILAAFFVPLMAVGYYAFMGSPEISSLAYADRQAERAEQQKITELTDKLYARLTSEPNGGASEGWMLLGQTYYRMGEYSQAAAAFETVTSRDDASSATFSMLAEALVSSEQGIVTPKAETAIDRAIELDPSNPAGAFYKSMAMAQKGEEAAAHALLLSQLDAADGFAPWMEAFIAQANQIARTLGRDQIALADYAPMAGGGAGPTAEDVAAAGNMSDEDRGEFIRSMVNRLAEKLEDKPDDLDGWLRLANAYTVLGEKPNAVSAYERALILLSDIAPDDPRHQVVEQALSELR